MSAEEKNVLKVFLTSAGNNDCNSLNKLLNDEQFSQCFSIDDSYNDSANALTYACALGNGETVSILQKHHANLNWTDKQGWTPLLWALVQGHYQIASHLVKCGAVITESQKTVDGHRFTSILENSKPSVIKMNELNEFQGTLDALELSRSTFGLDKLLEKPAAEGPKESSVICGLKWSSFFSSLAHVGPELRPETPIFNYQTIAFDTMLAYHPKAFECILEFVVQYYICPFPMDFSEPSHPSAIPLPFHWTAILQSSCAVSTQLNLSKNFKCKFWCPLSAPSVLFYILRYACVYLDETDFLKLSDQLQYVFLRQSATETASPALLLHAYHCLAVLEHFLSKDSELSKRAASLIASLHEIKLSILQTQLFKSHILTMKQLLEVSFFAQKSVSVVTNCSQITKKPSSLTESLKKTMANFSQQFLAAPVASPINLEHAQESGLDDETTASIRSRQTSALATSTEQALNTKFLAIHKGPRAIFAALNEWMASVAYLGLSGNLAPLFWTKIFEWTGRFLTNRILFAGLSKTQCSLAVNQQSFGDWDSGTYLSDKAAVETKLNILALENWIRDNAAILEGSDTLGSQPLSSSAFIKTLLNSLKLANQLCSFLQILPSCNSLQSLLETMPTISSNVPDEIQPEHLLHMYKHYQWSNSAKSASLAAYTEVTAYLEMLIAAQNGEFAQKSVDISFENIWDKDQLRNQTEISIEDMQAGLYKWNNYWNNSSANSLTTLLAVSHAVEPLPIVYLNDFLSIKFK